MGVNDEIRHARLYSATSAGVLHRLVIIHRPVIAGDHVLCPEDGKEWPCTSFLMIEEAVL